MDTQIAHDAASADAKATPCRRRYFLHGLLPQLMTLEACIRHGSVTRAARELRIAQPTASCLMRKLSITFGGPLMFRRQGRIQPTPLGARVLTLSTELIKAIDAFDARERSALERAHAHGADALKWLDMPRASGAPSPGAAAKR